MQALVVKAGEDLQTQRAVFKELEEPVYKAIQQEVGGHFELVRPVGLGREYVMFVNDDGYFLDLPVNVIGSYLYGMQDHGNPILGDLVIMKEGFVNGEPDVVGLEPKDVFRVLQKIHGVL